MKNMNGSHCVTIFTTISTYRYLHCPSPHMTNLQSGYMRQVREEQEKQRDEVAC